MSGVRASDRKKKGQGFSACRGSAFGSALSFFLSTALLNMAHPTSGEA